MRPAILAFQKWFVLNKTALHTWAMMVEVTCMVLIVASFLIIWWPGAPMAFFRIWGRRFGYFALIAYWLTLLPGILQRLKLFPLFAILVMTFRRTLGALMFLLVILHLLLSLVIPFIVAHRAFTFTNPRIFGTIAVALLFPLWLTSNNTSQNYLGKKWKWLQRLTYVALLFIFLHVSYFRPIWMVPTGIVLGLEILSWLVVWFRHQHQAKVTQIDGKIAS